MSVFDRLKQQIFEQDDKPAPAAAAAPAPVAVPPSPSIGFATATPLAPAVYTSPTIPAATITGPSVLPGQDDKAYSRLAADTDLNTDPIYSSVLAKAKALESILPVETTRFQAALATMANDGHTTIKDDFLRAFDTMLQKTQAIEQSYGQKLAQRKQTEVDQKTQDIANIEAKIAELTQQKIQLATEVAQSQGILQQKETAFNGALARRRMEISSEKAKFAAILH